MKYKIKEELKPLNGSTGLREDNYYDDKYYRYYSGVITANIRTISIVLEEKDRTVVMFDNIDGNFMLYDIDPDNMITEKTNIYDHSDVSQLYNENITGTISRYFSPQVADSNISWLPAEVTDKIKNSNNNFIVSKFIFFTGNFTDKSGRCAFQWPTISNYYPIIPAFPLVKTYFNWDTHAGEYQNGEAKTNRFVNRGLYISQENILEESRDRGNWISWEDNMNLTGREKRWILLGEIYNTEKTGLSTKIPDREYFSIGYHYNVNNL